MAVGLLVLIGWMLDVAALTSISPAWVTMKPNTALAFVLAGVALWIVHATPARSTVETPQSNPSKVRIAHASAAIVALIGLLTLSQYLFGWSLGIDQLLFEEPSGAVGTFVPGRMAPTTALGFLMIGLALLLFDTPRHLKTVHCFILAAGLIGLLNVVGYAYGARGLYGVAPYTQMAVHTAVGFIILSVGMLCARPDRGLMAIVTSDSVAGLVARRLLPAAIALPILLGYLSVIGQRGGLYSTEYGLALFALSSVMVLAALVWRNAGLLYRMDAERKRAEERLYKVDVELEERVEDRTARWRLLNESLQAEITERKQAERRLAAQHAITRVLAESATLAVAKPKILEAICVGLGWDLGEIWSVDWDANVLRCAEIWRTPSDDLSAFAALTREMTFAPGIGLPGRVWASGKSAWVADVVEDPNFLRTAIAAKEGLHGAFAFPILLGTDILGVVAFFSRRICQPDNNLLQMLGDIANQVGQFIARKRAEQSLDQSRTLLQSFVEHTPAAVAMFDKSLRYVAVSRRWLHDYRLGDQNVIGRHHYDVFPEIRERMEWQEVHQRCLAGAVERREEDRFVRQDGSEDWLRWEVRPWYGVGGEIGGIIMFTEVITERKRAEKALADRERRERIENRIRGLLLTSPGDGMFADVLDLLLETFESRFGFFGYIREEDGALVCPSMTRDIWEQCDVAGKSVVFPRASWGGLWGQILLEKRALYKNESHRVPKGHLPLFRSLGAPILNDGKLIGSIHVANRGADYHEEDRELLEGLCSIIAPVLDVRLQRDRLDVERKRAVETLRESERRFRTLTSLAPVGIFLTDAEGDCLFVNERCSEMLGMTPEEAAGRGWVRALHPDDRERIVTEWNAAAQTGGDFASEYRFQTAQGKVTSVHGSAVALRGEEGEIAGYLGTVTDITERKHVEETHRALYRASLAIQEPLGLQERLDRLLQMARTVLELDRVNILLADPDGQWLRAVASLGTREPVEVLRVPIGPAGGGIAQAYRTQQVVTWDGTGLVPEELRLKPPYDRIEAFRSRVFANVPLVVQGRAIGVLGADRKHTQRPLDSATLELLQLFAGQAALAIEHGRLYEAQRMAAIQLEARVEDRTRELHGANARLQEAMRRVEEVSRHKSDFIANMSHELRTPLNAVIGFAELLERQQHGSLTEKQARFVEHVLSSGRHLLQIINDLLDLSRIEAGRTELRPTPVQVKDLLERARTVVSAQAAAKSLTLALQVEPGLPIIEADPLRLNQMFLNLLSNAIKFTPEGGSITVTGRRVRSSQLEAHGEPSTVTRELERDCVEISVQDTGIGIAPEDLGRLFQEFVQLEHSLDKPRQGTGLGLAITKKLVELHGGQIWAFSDGSGRGSTFTVRLPL